MWGSEILSYLQAKKLPAVDSWMPEDARSLGQKQKEMYYLWNSKQHEHRHAWHRSSNHNFYTVIWRTADTCTCSGLHSRGTLSLGNAHWACLTPNSGGRTISTSQGCKQNCALFWKQISVSSKAVCCINILGKIIQNKGS